MARNVIGTDLEVCSRSPITGFFRNGCCDTCGDDSGQHTICAEMSDEFLAFSMRAGNDLSTPRPEFDFPGLVAGDFWCVCMGRWLEAKEAGVAPRIKLDSCHSSVLEYVDLDVLKKYSIPGTGACDI